MKIATEVVIGDILDQPDNRGYEVIIAKQHRALPNHIYFRLYRIGTDIDFIDHIVHKDSEVAVRE